MSYKLLPDLNGGNTKIPSCAVDQVNTAQNGCRPRTTAFAQAITVNNTSELAHNRDYTAVNGLV